MGRSRASRAAGGRVQDQVVQAAAKQAARPAAASIQAGLSGSSAVSPGRAAVAAGAGEEVPAW